jgi:hypothetical protein
LQPLLRVDAVRSDAAPEASEGAGELAFELAKSRLDRQVARLVELRTNGSILIAATALVASFLGRTSIDRSGLNTPNWVALAFVVAGVLTGIRPLWPVRDQSARGSFDRFLRSVPFMSDRLHAALGISLVWRLHLSEAEISEWANQDLPSLRLRAAKRLSEFAEVNSKLVYRRSAWIAAASLCLLGQVVAWTIGLAG